MRQKSKAVFLANLKQSKKCSLLTSIVREFTGRAIMAYSKGESPIARGAYRREELTLEQFTAPT